MALEFTEADELVIQASLPGLRAGRDLEVWISNGVLHLRAHGPVRGDDRAAGSDLHDGAFARDIPLPEGAGAGARATYLDGRLEIRVPLGAGSLAHGQRVPVATQAGV